MNFTLSQFVLLVLTAAVVVVAVYVVRLLRELSGTVTEARRFVSHLNELQPQLDRILSEAEGQLTDLRKVTQKVDGIAGNVSTITQKVAFLAAPSFEGGALSGSIKYITAAVSGVRMVMQMFRRKKEERKDEEDVPEEKEA